MSASAKILVADDSPMVRAAVSRTLQGAGYEVATAANGIEAVQTAYECAPDLIVLDIWMPRMNGYQVCRLLKNDPDVAAVPVIILTGSERLGDEFWSFHTGADRFLTKDYGGVALVDAVAELLEARTERPRWGRSSPDPEEVLSRLCALIDRELYSTTVERIQLEAVLRSLSEGVLTIDTDGFIGRANDALCGMLGVESSEIAGRRCDEALPEPVAAVTLGASSEALAAQTVVAGRESEIRTAGGRVTPVEISVAPLQDHLGKTIGCLCLYQDITRRKEIEALSKAKDDLTHMIIHDLRSPLTSLTGGLMTLEMLGDLNQEQRELVALSVRGGETLLGMINELLDISRMEDGSLRLSFSELDVRGLVDQAIGQVARLAGDRDLTLEKEIDPRFRSLVGDGEKLRRTLVNLLDNAIKFTPVGGTVTISAREVPEEGMAEFSVTDTGEGIPREAHDLIFAKFGQVESRRAGRTHSTGLGLTFCKMAVEAHGGRIWVESEPEKGSRFAFRIPLNGETPSGAAS